MNNLAIKNAQGEGDGCNQYLTFSVLGKPFAISIDEVREIIEVGNMTRVPMSNPCVRGVINLRGNVVPAVDLGYRLHQRPLDFDKRSSIVLVEIPSGDESLVLGMLVDEVNEILQMEPQDMQKTPQFGSEIPAEFIRHMGRAGNDFIAVLNLARLLMVEDLAARQDNETIPRLVSVNNDIATNLH